MKHLNQWNYYQLYCLQDNMLLLLFSNWFYGQMSENTVHYSSTGRCIHYTKKATTSHWKNAKMTFLTSTWRNWDLGICRSCRISSSSSWGTEYCLWYKTRHEWNKSSSLSSPFCTATCAINTAKFNRESDQSGSTNWNTFCTWGSFYKAQKIMDL